MCCVNAIRRCLDQKVLRVGTGALSVWLLWGLSTWSCALMAHESTSSFVMFLGVSRCVASGIAGWQDVAPHVDLRADGSGEKAGSALPSALCRFHGCVLFSSSYCKQRSNYLQLRVTVILFFPCPPYLSVFPKAIAEKGSMYDELTRSGYPGNRHGDGCACQWLPWNTYRAVKNNRAKGKVSHAVVTTKPGSRSCRDPPRSRQGSWALGPRRIPGCGERLAEARVGEPPFPESRS